MDLDLETIPALVLVTANSIGLDLTLGHQPALVLDTEQTK